ncbi:GNAT family N-acetyltransferase [Blastomyces gilchristii SLH14081]|uniref:GNAT family N-acetyltransferase n=1 Tax=Blastomyces gilchristii (strain SLH14081) TaxID=559298 RepID=A0A179UUB1_BLAGS|nr:GNAT family N-acetyltransferase [Blastomyces gilchristii SLH14081]OAT10819.1 GNAT family N-acetyltransferase [Blastomyces gilchristii SLH14081]
MAQPQAPYQSQFQPPLFQVQQWTKSFSAKTATATTTTTTAAAAATDGKEKYVISTDPSIISLSALTDAFNQEHMYWVKPLPAPVLKDMIDRSLCFGVYRCNNSNGADDNNNQNGTVDATGLTQIGFARLITDNITFAYLTDVYILPEYQGTGLGSWLLECVNAWVDGRGEYFRRLMMVTVGERAERYYQRVMGAETQGRTGDVLIMGRKGKGAIV